MKPEFKKALKKLQAFQLNNFTDGSIDIQISRVPHKESYFHSIRVSIYGAACDFRFGASIFDTDANESIKNKVGSILDELAKCNPAISTNSLRDLKQGSFFRLKDSETAPVWVRGAYVPSERKYSTHKCDDTNHERLVPGEVEVFTDFTY